MKKTNGKATKGPPRTPRKAADAAPSPSTKTFPIVGIGASAGGLEAILELLENVSEKPGLAFVVIVHQEPTHETMLPQILDRGSKLPVLLVEGETPVEVDHVYVTPPHSEVVIVNGVLRLEARAASGPRLPIDAFLLSLAEDQGNRAIAVILSGAASDGALGTKAIKAEAGIVFAQDESARFAGMPRAAVAEGGVDFVLPPHAIARELERIARSPYVAGEDRDDRCAEADLRIVYAMLRTSHGVDFSNYKPSTVERRIRRRMAIHKIEHLTDYLTVLRESPREAEQLYGDILIRVTGFFRDPEVFETLSREMVPLLAREREPDAPVRVWVPGCATGEEVYSLAIMLLEVMSGTGHSCPIQLFGTDVSEAAVERARAGIYPENITADVSPERLRRFFTRYDGQYRVSKAVRDCCIFARQNLAKDPPFSKLDLISCRNVLIYLGTALQRKVMSVFHYALQPDGYLLLGSSETVGNHGELFGVVDRKHKIYRKKPAASRIPVEFEPPAPRRERVVERPRPEDEGNVPAGIFREADRVVLARFSPAGVLINEAMEILQFRGRTSSFLEPPMGTASLNLLKMTREGLLADLRSAIFASRKAGAPVRREGIRVGNNGGTITVNIEVLPFAGPARERYQLVLFEEVAPREQEPPARGKKGKKEPEDVSEAREVAPLKRELEATREYLQSIIEEQEAMNEELRSANEEIQSSNEELQSVNEELETAKEELQSTNEELTTLNEELQNRNEELAQANNDLLNLLASVDIPIVMLDAGLRIRRFNPGAQRTLGLIPGDVGRPIHELKTTLQLDDLEGLVGGVIDNLEMHELEVQDRSGRWFSLRMRPYRTTENKIEGAVLVLIDIDQLRRSSAG